MGTNSGTAVTARGVAAVALALAAALGPSVALGAWRLSAPTALPAEGTPTSASAVDNGAVVELDATVEVYVAVDGNRPADGAIPGHLYDARHSEFGLAQALIGIVGRTEDARGALRLWTGQVPAQIYAGEKAQPVDWSLVQEATVGTRVGTTAWIDAGLMPAPFGFEQVQARSNWLWSGSLLHVATPFYLMGGRVQWAASEATTLEVGLYGGWNKIAASNVPSTFLARAFGSRSWGRWQLLVSTAPTRPEFSRAGTGAVRGWVVDGWLCAPLGAGYEVALQVNGGVEAWQSAGDQRLANWGALNAWARKTLDERWQLAARVGVFGQSGDTEVARGVLLGRPFWPTSRIAEAALALQYRATDGLMLRAEGRVDHAADAIFMHADGAAFQRPTVALGAIWSL